MVEIHLSIILPRCVLYLPRDKNSEVDLLTSINKRDRGLNFTSHRNNLNQILPVLSVFNEGGQHAEKFFRRIRLLAGKNWGNHSIPTQAEV